MMETMFQWLGMAVAWTMVGLIAWGLFNWTLEGTAKLHERLVSAVHLQARQELGREIAVQAHWFSESKEVQAVLDVLGKRLAENPQYRYDAEHVHKAWRKRLSEK
jgi:hypothetical protein